MNFWRTIHRIVFALTLGVVSAHAATPKIQVSTTPEGGISQGDSFSLRIAVELESTARIAEPQFNAEDFVIQGRSSAMEIVTVLDNGRFIPRRKNTYSYILSPKRAGTLQIKDIVVEVGGEKFPAGSKTLVVGAGGNKGNVANQGALPANINPGNMDDEDDPVAAAQDPSQHSSGKNTANFQLNSDFTVRLELSKKTAFVGEPIVAEYTLYDFGNLNRADVKRWPTFNGFFKEDLEIPNRYDFQTEYVGNRRVRKALIGRFALFPIKPGRIDVDKLVIDGAFFTNVQGGGTDPFQSFFGFRQLKQAAHASQEEKIQVEALPSAGRPDHFTGAVGKFTIDLKADKTQVKVNEPITLKFSISGIGNFHALEAPRLELPKELELYETSANVQANAARGVSQDLRRSMSFDLLVIPRGEGKFQVPALSWSYFDTEARAYKTLQTPPIALLVSGVAPGSNPPSSSLLGQAPAAESKSSIVENELRYLKPISELQTNSLSRTALYWLSVGLLLLVNILWLGLYTYRRRKNLATLLRSPNALRDQMQNALRAISRFEANGDSHELESGINILLDILLNQDSRSLTHMEIAALAETSPEARAARIQMLAKLRKDCEAIRFAPNPQQNQNKLRELAVQAKDVAQQIRDNV